MDSLVYTAAEGPEAFEFPAWGWAHQLRQQGYQGRSRICTDFQSLEKAEAVYGVEVMS